MKYMSGDYKAARNYFSRLSDHSGNSDYYKYIYWRARAEEKLFGECQSKGGGLCSKESYSFSGDLPYDNSFYGYLIKLRFSPNEASDRVVMSKPSRPDGETYERIEALALLGMRDEAVAEIVASLKRSRERSQFLYLGYMAMQLEKYREVIAFAEPKKQIEFLPYSYPLGYWDIVNQAARTEDLDAHLIAALIREESRFEPSAVSWAGAVGLMQLMPSTARGLKKGAGVYFKENSELQDAETNILLGSHYLSRLIDEFKDVPLAIAAYNAGENILKDWMSRFDWADPIEFIENIPYKETRNYVKKVLKSYWQYRTINGLPVDAGPVLCKAVCSH
jgi:soluble lytic murein transglycosylase